MNGWADAELNTGAILKVIKLTLLSLAVVRW